MVVDCGCPTQPVLGVLLMTQAQEKWFYPPSSPYAGEPLPPSAVELIKEVLEVYPGLTAEEAIEICWYFGGI
jgi:hypothetical protein